MADDNKPEKIEQVHAVVNDGREPVAMTPVSIDINAGRMPVLMMPLDKGQPAAPASAPTPPRPEQDKK